jgi:hypothetical protein
VAYLHHQIRAAGLKNPTCALSARGPEYACKIVPRRMPTPLGLNPWPSHLPAATVILPDSRRCEANSVPLYYFKLVDSIIVADHGVHELVDDDAARVEAIKLARSLRETRPQLRGTHCSISVTAEDGAGVCLVALDET